MTVQQKSNAPAIKERILYPTVGRLPFHISSDLNFDLNFDLYMRRSAKFAIEYLDYLLQRDRFDRRHVGDSVPRGGAYPQFTEALLRNVFKAQS